MSPLTFFIASFLAPFVGIAVLAPAWRGRRWGLVGAVVATIGVAILVSFQGRCGVASGVLRLLAVASLALGCGYLYQRWFMDSGRQPDPRARAVLPRRVPATAAESAAGGCV